MFLICHLIKVNIDEVRLEICTIIRFTLKKFTEEIIKGRCADKEFNQGNSNDCADFKSYLVYIDLDQVTDKEQRNRLKALPTSFVLQPEEVDELREAARAVLMNNKNLKKFINEL